MFPEIYFWNVCSWEENLLGEVKEAKIQFSSYKAWALWKAIFKLPLLQQEYNNRNKDGTCLILYNVFSK